MSGTAGARAFIAAPGSGPGEHSATAVLADADVALYAAKAAGKDRVVGFDDQLRDRQLQRGRTAERLRAALAAGQTALVRAIVDLARRLNLVTVAEGVETPEHYDLLRRLGCDRVQGYLLGRPVPAGAVLEPVG